MKRYFLITSLLIIIAAFTSIAAAFQEDKRGIEKNTWTLRQSALEIFLDLFKFRKIEIIGNSNLPSTVIKDTIFNKKTFNIFNTSAESIQSRVSSLPWIESVKVRFSVFPAILRVSIEESVPWILTLNKNNIWLISSTGQLIKYLNKEEEAKYYSLPRLKGIEDDNLTSTNQKFNSALKMIKLLEAANAVDEKIFCFNYIDSESMEIFADNEPIVLLKINSYEQLRADLRRLESVKMDINSRNETPNLIDLRFENQAIIK